MGRRVETLTACCAEISVVAVLWVGLFKLNDLLFEAIEVSGFINWIFLPAGLRILAVLLLGWRGVAGLFVGAMLTNLSDQALSFQQSLLLASVSALAPLIAVRVVSTVLHIAPDLKGLTFSGLAAFALAGAAFSTLLHNFYFLMSNQAHAWAAGLVSMLVGDVAGTLIILHLGALMLRRRAQQ